MINDGQTPMRDKAIMAIMCAMGLDESTFCEHFNYYGWPQIVKQLGPDPAAWDLSKCPIRIDFVRSKTQYAYYNFLPAKAVKLLRLWPPIRRSMTFSEIKIATKNGQQISDPLFLTTNRNPIDERNINKLVRFSSFRSGVQEYVPGTKIYRIHAHEFRDTFKTTARISGVDGPVADFFIGHNIDEEGYDKSPWANTDFFRDQYPEDRATDMQRREDHALDG